jgi:peptidyl-tRNA hydrolase
MQRDPATVERWEHTGEAIIVLRVESEEQVWPHSALNPNLNPKP